MDWVELGQMLKQPLTQLIVLGVVLVYYCICYSARVAGGKRRTSKQGERWSWARFWSDIVDRLQMIYVLVACIIGADMTQWLAPLIGINLDETVTMVINAAFIVAIPFVAGISELYAAVKNATKLWGWSKNIKSIGLNDERVQDFNDEKYDKIAESVGKFLESITKSTSREQLVEDGVEVKDGKTIEVKQDGLGSGNTYPEPYRSAKKDSMLDPSTCYNRECVSYTAWKICETTGKWPVRTGSMNAKEWIYRLPSWGYKQVSAPKNGGKYIGVNTSGTYGHIVWFESEINSTTVQISEYNYADLGNYGVRNIPKNTYIWFAIKEETKAEKEDKKELDKLDTIEYTYKPGDTFGEVIKSLGLNTSHGLWGPDGDVEYYTKQLGISGNIPVGAVLTFTRRK